MATYQVNGPAGAVYQIDGPDNADPSAIIAQVQGMHRPQSLDFLGNGQTAPTGSPAAKAAQSATGNFWENTRDAFGQAFTNAGRGLRQTALTMGANAAVNEGDITPADAANLKQNEQQRVADAQKLDAPLLKTGGGKVGSIAGNMVLTAPTMAIPGANTISGAGLIGATQGLIQPSSSDQQTLLNTALGGAAGAGGQYAGSKVAQWASNRLASRQAAAQAEAQLNSARDATLRQSRAAGYVIPPTAANDGMAATALESVSGKAATRQVAEAMNARVSNRLVAQDLGLPASQPLTREALQGVREQAGQIYGTVKNAGTIVKDQPFLENIRALTNSGADLEAAAPGIGAQANEKVTQLADSLLAKPEVDAGDAVGLFKLLNERAKANFKAAFGPGGSDSQALELARAQKGAADELGDLIQRHLANNGQAQLGQQWQNARILIAKSYTAENALKGNNVDAVRLAAQLRKGAPLSGGFKTVADFADQFGEAARVPKSGAGVSKLAATLGGGGALGAALSGNLPLAAGALGASALPWATRQMLLSQAGQRLLATPSYAPGLLGTTALRGAGLLGEYGTQPALGGLRGLIQAGQ